MAAITGDWLEALRPEFSKPYYRDLFAFVQQEYRTRTIYPPAQDLFNALHETPLGSVRAVILGQDPYHGEGQAHGMCFSVRPGCPPPPSLINIFRELHDDLGCFEPDNGYLIKWARQGVLLLNTVLTVRYRRDSQGCGRPGSADRLHALGDTRPDQGGHAGKSPAPHPQGSPPQPPVRLPRVFRLQALQQMQCLPGEKRSAAHRLAD